MLNIFYCKRNKRNYFLLGYFYNHSGIFNILEHYKKAKEIADEYNFDISKMEVFEIDDSRRYKNMVVMYCSTDNQNPVKDAHVVDSISESFYG